MADDPLPPWMIPASSSAPSPPREPDADDLVALLEGAQRDRYRPTGLLGEGGMGAVEAVLDEPLERTVVRKRIHPRLQKDALHARMFVREARVTGRLQHPCIVPIHELGVGPDRHLYYTMDRIHGRTLEEWIASLPPGRLERGTLFDLLDVVVRVCDALAYAHSQGVLHCDVKPANVMVAGFGRVYLMDWGIARFLDEERRRVGDPTLAEVRGSLSHMAPEQARGEPLDERADVFAAGALVYSIVTRQAPFASGTALENLAKAYIGRYEPLEAIEQARGTPAALARIVQRAMAVRREDRYASMDELRDALVAFMRGADAFPRATFEAGAPIVREGEHGDEAYVIESGRCEVHRTVDGQRVSIRVMGPGEIFGEMAILAAGARTASVTALEPTVLLRITADALAAEVDAMKPWMSVLVRTLAERFRERDSR
jgi:serine/threonine-protein kinase